MRNGMPRTLDEAFAVFEARTNLEKGIPPGNPNRVYRLDRMKALCEAFGNPQDAVPSIHIAGSKGKGSTAAYTAALIASGNRRVGIYTSPHLLDYRERFRLYGEDFPEEAALSSARDLLTALPDLEAALPGEGGATTFELLTLFAFLFFRRAGCDFMVLETGLGGRLDATNVVGTPEAVIITPIEKEHTDILGRRLSGIAAEKAGIMKPGIPVFSAAQKGPVRRVLRRRARELGCRLRFLPDLLGSADQTGAASAERSEISASSPSGDRAPETPVWKWNLSWRSAPPEEMRLSIGGKVQAENAALAISAVRHLYPGTGNSVLSDVNLPGRFQILSMQPLIVLDGAHTPRSVRAACSAFGQLAEDKPLLLFGSVLGKDHRTMARILCGGSRPAFDEVIVSTPGSFKPSNPAAVADSFRRTGARTSLIPDPAGAWDEILKRSGGSRDILVCGSFFMAAEIAARF